MFYERWGINPYRGSRKLPEGVETYDDEEGTLLTPTGNIESAGHTPVPPVHVNNIFYLTIISRGLFTAHKATND